MNTKTKLIYNIYLYLAAGVSLIFVAVGLSIILNTWLKAAVFTEAEKKSYWECNQQPPIYGTADTKGFAAVATEDQKQQLDNLLKDYQNWKENQTGEKCIKPARQNRLVDAFTMFFVSLPILIVHWLLIRKERKLSN